MGHCASQCKWLSNLETIRLSWKDREPPRGIRNNPPDEGGSNFSQTYLHNFERLENRSPTRPDAALPVGVTVLEEHILDEDPNPVEVGR